MVKMQTEVQNSGQIVLEGLPFKKGEIVDIIIVTKNEIMDRLKEWKMLLKVTQTHVQEYDVTEQDIEEEINLYRINK